MQDTKLFHLTFEIGKVYIYRHCAEGYCDHMIIFNDIRML